MGETWRIFKLLMYKNMLVRRKHWKIVLFLEVMIPLLLILYGQGARTVQSKAPTRVDNNTYHRIIPMQPAPWAFELRYTPKNNLTDRIMSKAGQCMRIHDNQMIGSESEGVMVNEIISKQELHPFLQIFGIVFENIGNDSLSKKFRYKFRTPRKLPKNLYQNVENGNAATLNSLESPLTLMQICLDRAYIEEATRSPTINMTVTTQQMPYPPFVYANSSTLTGGLLINLLAGTMFYFIMFVEVNFAINEKDMGINFLMSVNGVKNVQNLLSWLISGVMFSVVYLAPIVIMLKSFFLPMLLPYLAYSNSFIVWIVLTIHVGHILAFAMHTTVYQWRPVGPMFITFIIMILMDYIKSFATDANYTTLPIYLGILSPNIMLNRIFDEINFYENKLIGVNWNNLFTPGDAMAPRETSLGALIIFSILGILAHFLLAVYLYAVRPGMYGVAQHPLYFLQKRKKVLCDGDVTLPDYDREDRKEFERVPEGTLTPGIQIRDLTKTYVKDFFRRTAVQALRGIDVDFYKGQITALVGHDGAGKTTMASVLSGLTASTEGMVLINGKDVQHDRESVQRNLGFCPQENIVFPDLSVFEQVMFFGMLKAGDRKTKDDLTKEVEILLEKMNLTDKKNSLPNQLSGGQKRRMCLAMAVIGDPSVLILDEPTSGMDAESKREVRDIILKLRGDATILISTHDMEEADILGDRIAIIHSGKLRCYGTSMFLKKLYSDGQVEVTLSTEPSCEPQRIVDEIGLSAQLLSVDDGKVVLATPFADNLPEALDTLEKRKSELGITALSVSLITLEQVFLRVMREHGDETNLSNEAAESFDKLTGFRYFGQTVGAFFAKKITHARKRSWSVVVDMLMPSISAVLVAADYTGSSNIRSSSLTLDAYRDTRSIAYAQQDIYGEKYVTSAKGFGGTATYIGPNDNNLIDALLASAVDDLNAYRTKFIVSGEFNITNENIVANGLYSGTALLGVPASVNMLTNTIVKVLTGDDEYSISVWAEELPRSYRSSDKPAISGLTLSLGLIFFLGPALVKYVSQPLHENFSGLKQLQVMTGASKLAYWGCTYLFDLLQYTVTILLLIAAFVIADARHGTQYYHGTEIMTFFLLLLVFGASVLPLVYIFSFWKKTNDKYFLLNMAPLFLVFSHFLSLGQVRTVNEETNDLFGLILSRTFLLLPHTSVIYGHMSFFNTVLVNSRCRRMSNAFIEAICSRNAEGLDQCCYMNCWNGTCDNPAPYFVLKDTSTVLLDSLMLMAGSAVLFFGIIYVLEKKIVAKLYARFHRTPLNSETETTNKLVEEEAHKVTEELDQMLLNKNDPEHARNENIFFVRELSKSYGSLNAVKGISFRVKQGECFGLLGVNGAGKTTTFRVLTGEELPNSGVMYLNECSLDKERKNYLAEIGYCPQEDALLDSLNSWDHLNLFARLRGIPKEEVKATVEKWINKLNLTACASEPSGTYSSGNRRRLSIAMALIGNPLLVLMDEPTTAMDPAARRSLWKTLKTCQESGQSIILTSQSMEECEVLCKRLVIMRKGQLVCVGTRQELKQRFGVGYNIHVKLNPGCQRTDVEKIKNQIGTTLLCKLTDENKGFIGFHVTDRQATWTKMYTMMNELKADYDCIEDFAVLSSTLEQLFIQFARAPGDADETDLAESAPALQDTEKESKKDL